jgi:hypothetical protein
MSAATDDLKGVALHMIGRQHLTAWDDWALLPYRYHIHTTPSEACWKGYANVDWLDVSSAFFILNLTAANSTELSCEVV